MSFTCLSRLDLLATIGAGAFFGIAVFYGLLLLAGLSHKGKK